MRVKICLVGDRGVGKTSLLRRFAADQYMADEKGTLGAHMHPIEVDITMSPDEVAKVRADLFDFMGEHALRDNFRDAIFYGAHGTLAVCDLSRPDTLRSLVDWIQAVSSVAGEVPAVIACNKVDLRDSVAVGASDMRSVMAQLPGVTTKMTSALTGQGVEETFNEIILRSVEGILAGQERAASRESLRYRILAAIAHKDITGRSKGEIIEAFKTLDPKVVMAELDTLVELGLITPVEYTAATFVDTKSIPVTSHFTITPAGKEAVAAPRPRKLVIGDS